MAGGNAARDKVDVGTARTRTASALPLEGLVASKDKSQEVPEGAFFREMVELLKREYVDPISDESKLAEGAVRGMVQSLEDAQCIFYDDEAFAIRRAELKGDYQGIGVDFVFVESSVDVETPEESLMGRLLLPRLVVAAVVPGGPADLAGVRAGDWVASVDGHWAVNTREIKEFRDTQKRFAEGKVSKDAFEALRKSIQAKSEKTIMPMRAREKMTHGLEGTVNVVWNRGAEVRTTKLDFARSHVEPIGIGKDALALRFLPGAEEALREAIAGKKEVTIDLRGQVSGDFETMRRCLAAVAKDGSYGVLSRSDGTSFDPLVVQGGNPAPPKLRLLVDPTTRGEAEVFALALAAYGGAKLVGSKSSGEPFEIETVAIAGGGGYSLVTGEYRRQAAHPVEVKS